MKPIVLASGSPRRRELLEGLGFTFIVDPSGYEENMSIDTDPLELAKMLSLGKAQDVTRNHPDSIIIGADTLVAFSGKVLGKPHTKNKAIEMLMGMNGKQHSVITGYTVIDTNTGRVVSEAVETRVHFRNVARSDIEKYVETGEPLDKAGAYAIFGGGAFLIEKVEGDPNNVSGLPVDHLLETLKKFGVNRVSA